MQAWSLLKNKLNASSTVAVSRQDQSVDITLLTEAKAFSVQFLYSKLIGSGVACICLPAQLNIGRWSEISQFIIQDRFK